MSDIQAWAYSAALFCCHCAEQAHGKEALANGTARDREGNAPSPAFADSSEADSPQHCDSCGEFLENSLTDDGVEYVVSAIVAHETSNGKDGDSDTIKEWREYYGANYELENDVRRGIAAHHAECEPDDLNGPESYMEVDDCLFRHAGSQHGPEYVVLTDREADECAQAQIAESLWAFRPEWLGEFTGLPANGFRAIQEAEYEAANEFIRACIDSKGDANDGLLQPDPRIPTAFERFCERSISADGRGHFLAHYDHAENEIGDYFVYRVN